MPSTWEVLVLRLYKRVVEWLRRRKTTWLPDQAVKAPVSTPEERRQWIIALGSHPGFQLLTLELNNRRVRAQRELRNLTESLALKGSLEDFRAIVRAQEEAYWSNWLQMKLEHATNLEPFVRAQMAPKVPASQ